MPSEGTARQTVRIDSDLWTRFGDATERADPPTDRSTALRDFAKWYVRERGAKLPKRPTAAEHQAASGSSAES